MAEPKIKGGYILLSRKLIESKIFDKPPLYLKVWVYLITKAQHKQYKDLKRGQLWTSIPEIMEACSWYKGFSKITPSKKRIFTIIDWLRNPYEGNDEGNDKETMIETMKGTHGMLVSIVNYNVYQTSKNYEGNDEGNDENSTKGLRREREGNNINKNDKNDKNEEEESKKESPPPKQHNYQIFKEHWNSKSRLKPIREITDKRRSKLKIRLKEFTEEEILEAIDKADKSDFCNGDNNRNWKITFNWLIENKDNLLKTLEGNYDNEKKSKGWDEL
jgi:hypothetical protein